MDAHADDDPTKQLGEFWHKNLRTIEAITEGVAELGQQLSHKNLPHVLCHADIHTNNIMLDAARGEVHIVDWDEAVLAPKERDLMFVVGGGISRSMVSPQNEVDFFNGYGKTEIDQLALAFYRYAWAINDIAEYASQVLLRPDLGELSRASAVTSFKFLFAPGNIVSRAIESTTHFPE